MAELGAWTFTRVDPDTPVWLIEHAEGSNPLFIHDPTTGGGQWFVYQGRAYPIAANADHVVDAVPAGPDQVAEFVIRPVANNTNDYTGVWLRRSLVANTGYMVRHLNNGVPTLQVVKWVAGASTVIYYEEIASDIGSDIPYYASVMTDGSTAIVTVKRDGVNVFSPYVDTTPIADGYMGVVGGNGASYKLDSLTMNASPEAAPPEMDTIPINESNSYLSRGNWDIADDESSAQATDMASYFIPPPVTGAALLKMTVDQTNLDAAEILDEHRPVIGWEVRDDEGFWEWGSTQLTSGIDSITIASGLDPEKTYYTKVYNKAMYFTYERFLGGYDTPYAWRVVDIRASAGAVWGDPYVPEWIVIQFGDSTVLGYITEDDADPVATDSHKGWDQIAARANGEDVSNCGVGATGYTMGHDNIPSLLNGFLLNCTEGRARNFTGVNEIRIRLGHNDVYVDLATDEEVADAITDLLALIRSDVSPTVLVTFQLPMSLAKAAIITSTVETLMEADENVRLMDYGPQASLGLMVNGASETSNDGVHPNRFGHWLQAAVVAAKHAEGEGETVIIEGSGRRTYSY